MSLASGNRSVTSGSGGGGAGYVQFSTGHEDLVHDVAYDYYGKRMATVSSDQQLKVFDLNPAEEWVLSDSFKAHDASINRVIWGPPEHGQIIATCSYDRTVRIWEEQELENKNSGRRWKRQFQMASEPRTAIYDICFPPTSASSSSTSTGLKLGFISTDGTVHIYECREPQDLTHWIAVDVIRTLSLPPPRESEVSFCLDFCPSHWGGEQLVVGVIDKVQVYRHNALGKFRPAEELKGHRGLIRDVSWAASAGRSYHLIATACKDGHVRIFKLTASSGSLFAPKSKPTGGRRPRPGAGAGVEGLVQGLGADELLSGGDEGGDDGADGWTVELKADFSEHNSDVWKVAWNATGTVLSSAADDGSIRLWKAVKDGNFECVSMIFSQKYRYVVPVWRDDDMLDED
ncbi:epoxide hydrolase, soluble (sEH) [Rhizina undulata]